MRVVIQRVKEASVSIEKVVKSRIKQGLVIMLGIEDSDTDQDIEWLCNKIINLRIFDDENGTMNLSSKDIDADILLVSQFTLYASTKKGNRPSYLKSSKREIAIPLYKKFCISLQNSINKGLKTGEFGANMEISLINDGPVTIIIDSKKRE